MDTQFNVFEILEIAERVEQRGANFYLDLARRFEEQPPLRDCCRQLAERKARLKALWTRMRKEFSERTGEFGTYDPDNYVLSHPEVMAGLTWLGTQRPTGLRITGHESQADILRDAWRRENAVITFFQGLEGFARDPATREVIETLVRRETDSLETLMDQLAGADSAGAEG